MVPSPANDENPANDDAFLAMLPHATQIGVCGGPAPQRIVSYWHRFEGPRMSYKMLLGLKRAIEFLKARSMKQIEITPPRPTADYPAWNSRYRARKAERERENASKGAR